MPMRFSRSFDTSLPPFMFRVPDVRVVARTCEQSEHILVSFHILQHHTGEYTEIKTTEISGSVSELVSVSWPKELFAFSDFVKRSLLYCSVSPWGRGTWNVKNLEDKTGDVLVISPSGFCNNIWLDGPMMHLARGGVFSFVEPGGPARLLVPSNEGRPTLEPRPFATITKIRAKDPELHRRCLLHAFGHRLDQCFGDSGTGENRRNWWEATHFELHIESFTLKEALTLVLLKQLFMQVQGGCQFEILGPEPSKDLLPLWRRLFQNLGIETVKIKRFNAKHEKPAFPLIEVGPLASLISDDCTLEIAREINCYSSVIPEKLLDRAFSCNKNS